VGGADGCEESSEEEAEEGARDHVEDGGVAGREDKPFGGLRARLKTRCRWNRWPLLRG
jgi:hypothetical protein